MDNEAAIATVPSGGAIVDLNQDECKLVSQAKHGSRRAAEELVRRHWSTAYLTAYLILGGREDAEDVTQEAFVSALRSLGRFRMDRPFEPWLRKIVVNRSLDAARSRRRDLERDASIEQAAQRNPQAQVTPLISDERLSQAIHQLPLKQRTVVVLHSVLGYETSEVSRILRIPRGTVGSRLRRGLDQLEATYRRET